MVVWNVYYYGICMHKYVHAKLKTSHTVNWETISPTCTAKFIPQNVGHHFETVQFAWFNSSLLL